MEKTAATAARGAWKRPAFLPLALFLLFAPSAGAEINGSVAGWVRDGAGIPQMGALVTLLTETGEPAQRTYTDHRGAFQLDKLLPGSYAIRVTLSRFLPVVKEGIRVAAGERTFLDVNLRGLFSSLQLTFPGGGEIRDMSDEWKWVLRTSASTRPVLRFQSARERETRSVLRSMSGTFSDTHAYAQVSAGGGLTPSGLANESDLGTTFAVATSLFGNNDLMVSGNLGYSSALTPSSAFRTSYRREMGLVGAPEVSVTVRQLQTPVAAGRALFSPVGGDSAPSLQTLAFGYNDEARLGASTTVKYGFLYESVSFVNRLDFVSPYGKLIHQLGGNREVELRYASGVPRPDQSLAGSEALRQQVSSLALFPRLSLREGSPAVQRSEHIEAAYRERFGTSLLEVAIFQDALSDAAISAFVPAGHYAGGDVLPDLFGRTSTLNGGRHASKGFRVSYARKLRERIEAALGYGIAGALAPGTAELATPRAEELRSTLEMRAAQMVMASLSTRLPGSETQVVSTYQWVSRPSAIGVDLYNEFAARSDPGWNLIIRQPLPATGMFPGRFEVTADFRNLLRSGYIQLQTFDGQPLYLLQAIRSYRGAVSFIF